MFDHPALSICVLLVAAAISTLAYFWVRALLAERGLRRRQDAYRKHYQDTVGHRYPRRPGRYRLRD